MEENRTARPELDDEKQYKAIICNADGSRASPTEFSDWFADDDAAREGFIEILHQQGYGVAHVEIGFPCVVTLR